eukprot:scaffold8551_cov132-Isochrysis_galbana.AAC.8
MIRRRAASYSASLSRSRASTSLALSRAGSGALSCDCALARRISCTLPESKLSEDSTRGGFTPSPLPASPFFPGMAPPRVPTARAPGAGNSSSRRNSGTLLSSNLRSVTVLNEDFGH